MTPAHLTASAERDALIRSLLVPAETRIVFLIVDGLGGLPDPGSGLTELESAATPHLDRLAARASLGLLEPVAPGITPGSGPAHLALFGYDPQRFVIGRGVLSALGVEFPLEPGDVCARVNFATVDAQGRITDRRAGRLDTGKNRELTERLSAGVRPPPGVRCFFRTEKEHRALFVMRGPGLSGDIEDTDPQLTGTPPLAAAARSPAAEASAAIVRDVALQSAELLRGESQANMLLLRGFDGFQAIPDMRERYGLRSLAIARYPMYRGLARLVGMEVHPVAASAGEQVDALAARWRDFDFFYLHVKEADSRGEDRDFAGKVKVLEEVDALIPRILALEPDVLAVTGDHSTPAALGTHSWHPVPLLFFSPQARADRCARFGETECLGGAFGLRPSLDLMPLALAHALRFKKYGA